MFVCMYVPPIKMVCLGTLLLFYSTLMSLTPIRVVHPGTDPIYYNSVSVVH